MVPGTLQVPSYSMLQVPLLFRYCMLGMEFRSVQTQECVRCTPLDDLDCADSVTRVACTATKDAHCMPVSVEASNSFCNNNFVDFGEQCDASAKYLKTASCCTDSTCLLLEGYYTDPPCSTICGDNIVAGLEECDSFADSNCDMTTCNRK